MDSAASADVLLETLAVRPHAVQNLLSLVVSRRQAYRHATRRKGPWHMATAITSGVGMTNGWLHDQGLVSLESLWVKRASLRRTP